jgi:tetratricopeptide (TPR) repeat protein
MRDKFSEWNKIQTDIDELHNSRKYDEGIRLTVKSLAFARTNFGVKSVYFANSLSLIALGLFRLGDFKKSEKFCDRAIKLYGLIKTGKEAQMAATSSFYLTALFMDMELYEKAMNSIIFTAKTHHDYNEMDLWEIDERISTIIQEWEVKDGLDKVEKFFRKIYKKASTGARTEEKKIELLWAFHFLAFFFSGLENKQKRAAILNKHVLDTLLKSSAEQRAQAISILAKNKFKLTAEGKFPEALEVSQKIIEALSLTKTPETENMALCTSFISMANIYNFMGDLAKASRIYQTIFSKLEKFFDGEQQPPDNQLNGEVQSHTWTRLSPVHEAFKDCLRGFMNIYKKQGQMEALTEIGLYLIEKLKKVAPEHMDIPGYTGLLFSYNPELLQKPEAEKLLLEQFNIIEKNMPESAMYMYSCLNALSIFYSNAELYEKAILYKNKLLELTKQSAKEIDGNIVHHISDLGKLYWGLNDSETAEKYYLQSIQACELIDDKEKWITIRTIKEAANFYAQNHRYDEAEFYCHEILSILQENNWSGHPGKLTALEILAEIQEKTGRGWRTRDAAELADNARKNLEPIYHEDASETMIN